MPHLVERLQNDLDRVARFLGSTRLLSFQEQEQQDLKAATERLFAHLRTIQGDSLTAGILGGTGVGKSTLLNALSDAPIATASHRRPYTDRVLVYRYVNTPLPPLISSTDMPWTEITHEKESIQQVLLCDLPDFDSLLQSHRARVLDFVEHLDLLVWVSSPEKYADASFYEFLTLVPKAKANFYFVLNKTDLLFKGVGSNQGYEQMASVLKSYEAQIRESGVQDPVLFPLSAQEVLDTEEPAPWNAFPAFKQQLLRQRGNKQIAAIKTANLEAEIQGLLEALKREDHSLRLFESAITDVLSDLAGQRDEWIEGAQEYLNAWLSALVREGVLAPLPHSDALMGPGRSLALAADLFRTRNGRNVPEILESEHTVVSGETAGAFQKPFKWLEDRLSNRLARRGLQDPFMDWVGNSIDFTQILSDLKERLSHMIRVACDHPKSQGTLTFKAFQTVSYALLAAVFLLALGTETAWKDVFSSPGFASVLGLLSSLVHSLFSARGLAALCVYVLLNIILALRFYGRLKRREARAVERLQRLLSDSMLTMWKETIDSVSNKLEDLRKESMERRDAISTPGDG